MRIFNSPNSTLIFALIYRNSTNMATIGSLPNELSDAILGNLFTGKTMVYKNDDDSAIFRTSDLIAVSKTLFPLKVVTGALLKHATMKVESYMQVRLIKLLLSPAEAALVKKVVFTEWEKPYKYADKGLNLAQYFPNLQKSTYKKHVTQTPFRDFS